MEAQSKHDLTVAFHEAGHLVAAYRHRIPFTGRKAITIVPSEGYEGVFIHQNILRRAALESDDSDRSRLKMERLVQVCLGGIEAQRRYDPSSIRYGEDFGDWDGGSDYHQAIDLIDYFTSGPKESEAYLELLRIRTENLMVAGCNWNCIEAIARALIEMKTLSAKAAINIIQRTVADLVARSRKPKSTSRMTVIAEPDQPQIGT